MRFYNTQHPFYCGIDLHARAMYVCILNQAGETLLHRNMQTTPEALLKVIAPYRPAYRRRGRMHVHLVLARRPLRR